MNLNKKNNKGFTLIELILTISIFSIVLSIGYWTINNYNISASNQETVTQNQLSINNINKFITKDIEESQEITLEYMKDGENQKFIISNSDTEKEEYHLENLLKEIIEKNNFISSKDVSNLTYKYTIKKIDDSKSLSYVVHMKYDKNKAYMEYSIDRVLSGESNLQIISNYRVQNYDNFFTIPLSITKRNPYLVSIQNEDSNGNMNRYEFQVASRITDKLLYTQPQNPQEIPGFTKDYSSVGFWTQDQMKQRKNNLCTWISYQDRMSKMYGNQDKNNNISDISLNLSSNDREDSTDNSGKVYSHIGRNTSNWNASAYLQCTKAMNIDKVMIYVKGCTTLSSLKDKNEIIQGFVKIEGTGYITVNSSVEWNLYGGDDKYSGTWYEAQLSQNNKKNLNLSAQIFINKEQIEEGYALVVYGKGI